MKRITTTYLFISFFIVGFCTLTAYSYNDLDLSDDDHNLNESIAINIEPIIETVQGYDRVKRALFDPTMMTDLSAGAELLLNGRALGTSNSSEIYIITSLGYTSEETTFTMPTSITSENPTASITTASSYNGTYIITSFYQITSTTTTTTTTTTSVTTTTTSDPNFCNNGTYVKLANGTCASRDSLQTSSISTLYSNSSNVTEKADALSTYITSITNGNISSNSNNTLTIDQINNIVSSLNATNYVSNNNNSVLVITKPEINVDEKTVIGVSYQDIIGGTVVSTVNKENVTHSNISTAIIVSLDSLVNATSFNMLIINDPDPFAQIDNTSNRTIASSVAVATLGRLNSNKTKVDVSLYFQVVKPPSVSGDVTYLCTFYDTNTSQWRESGCTLPIYNKVLDRYECNCNHLTSFALIWLPKPSGSSQNNLKAEWNAQDIASIIFQVISICCFVAVVIHGVVVKFTGSKIDITFRLSIPIMSCAVTLMVFIFWIALSSTVYSRFSQPTHPATNNRPNRERSLQEDSNEWDILQNKLNSRLSSSSDNSSLSNVPCLSNELTLMFIVYFFLIFMFCIKISIGYYNYYRYVKFFPPPSQKSIVIAIIISCSIAFLWMIIAVSVNSNPSNKVTEIYLGKICWFSHQVIHYFLTLPICIFLAITIVGIVLVTRSTIKFVNDAESYDDITERIKYTLIVVLTSCVLQGLGWLFGPMILIANPKAADVLGWLFIIFNGLEGLWVIILYILARKSYMDEKERERQYREKQDGAIIVDNNDIYALALRELPEVSETLSANKNYIERRLSNLKRLKSDSRRNSFTDISAPQRRYPVYSNGSDDL